MTDKTEKKAAADPVGRAPTPEDLQAAKAAMKADNEITDEDRLAIAKAHLDEMRTREAEAQRAAHVAQVEFDRLQLIVDRKLGPPSKRLYANLAAYKETQRKLREARAEEFGILGRAPLDDALRGRKKQRVTGPVDLKGTVSA